MADNILVSQGTGTTIATKESGGAHHQKALLEFLVGSTPTLVSASDALPVSIAATVAISAVSLPLPDGAATSAKQDTIIGHVDGIEGQLTTLAGYLDGVEGLLAGTLTVSGTVTANLDTLNGAATSAKQDTIIGHVDGIEGQLTTLAGYLDGLEGYVDGLEGQLTTLAGYVDGVEGQLTTITGHVDGVETLLGSVATETTLSAVNSKLDTIDDIVKTEDAAHSSGDKGIMPLAVRNDAGSVLAGADGDYVPLTTDDTGALRVTSTGGGGGGTEYTEGATDATITGTAMLFEDTGDTLRVPSASSPLPVDAGITSATEYTEGDVDASISGTAILFEGTSDTLRVPSASNPLPVTPPSTTNAGATAKTSDYDTGGGTDTVTMMGIALPASGGAVQGGTSTNPVRVDPTGTTSQPVTQATASNFNAQVVGSIAHDAADSGNPVKIGGKARQTNPTAVADADRTDLFTDDVGRPVVVMNQCRDLCTSNTVDTTGTGETTLLAAGGSGVFHDLTHLSITNASATATVVTLRDSTGGSGASKYNIAANGGIVINWSSPKKQTTANNNWTVQSSASVNLSYNVDAVKNV